MIPLPTIHQGDKAAIDEAGVATAIAEMSTIFDVCQETGNQVAEFSSPPRKRSALHPRPGSGNKGTTAFLGAIRTSAFSSNAPADKLGECGGRATYTSYNHANGTTSGTYAYQNYCTVDYETETETTLNGSITFTETGTPGAYGPITSRVEADSPDGVTETTRNNGGQVLNSRLIKIVEFVQDIGVPGEEPTSSNPDRITAEEISFTNQVSGKTYRQTQYTVTQFFTPSGGEQMTVSGRGYRSNGEYFNVSTSSPHYLRLRGRLSGGQFTFTGADNSIAVLTVVPGSIPQGTLTVNGEPVTNVPVCR